MTALGELLMQALEAEFHKQPVDGDHAWELVGEIFYRETGYSAVDVLDDLMRHERAAEAWEARHERSA